MPATLSSQDPDFALLSPRERRVVESVAEGRTDEQIAQAMGIATATVNSYWTRIRLKLGSLSRTEIASMYLRRQMLEQRAAYEAEIERLRGIGLGSPMDPTSVSGDRWRFLALSHLLVPALVVARSGEVLCANPRACGMFRATNEEIEGKRLWQLIRPETAGNCQARLEAFFGNEKNRRTFAGDDHPYYAQCRNGHETRIVFSAEWYESPDGRAATVLIREHSEEAVRYLLDQHRPASLI